VKTTLRMDAEEIQRVLIDHLCRTRDLPQGEFDIRFKLFVDGAASYAELTVDAPEGSELGLRNMVQINRLVIDGSDAPQAG
jgi:hypothetical protein